MVGAGEEIHRTADRTTLEIRHMTLITLRKIILPLIGLAVVALLYLRGDNLVAWEPGSRATFWVLTSTAVGVFWYAVLTYQLLRAGYTPILTATYRDNQTVIRNNGKGAALNGTLTSHEGDPRLTLGDIPPGDERAFQQTVGWDLTSSYYLFYQDVFGRWYATKSLAHIVSNAASFPITNAFQGRIFNPPAESARQASSQSLLEYVLQVGHWWSPRNWYRWLKAYVKKRWIAIRIMRTARHAVKTGVLVEPFDAKEFARVVDWPAVVAERFMSSHRVGNLDREREYFIASETAGRFNINRKVRP